MKSKIQPGTPAIKQTVKATTRQDPHKQISSNLIYLLIGILAFVLYGNTISNYYSVDDSYVTSVNPQVQRGIKAIPEIFSTRYVTMNAEEGGQHNYGYRPFTKATYAVEWSLFGGNPHVSHFINVLLFALTGILLFSILRRLLKKHTYLLPLITVVFFMVHPIHTEVVASLKNREELLSFLGALLSLHFFMKWHESQKNINILWALLTFAAGYLSKPNIMIFPLILPLVMYFFTDMKPKKIIISFILLLVVMFSIVAIPRLLMESSARPMQFIENPLMFDNSFGVRFGTSLVALMFYLKMLIFPHPLVFYYGYNMIPVSTLADPLPWLSLAIHTGLVAFALYTFKKKSIFSFAILFYLINIGIFSNILSPPAGIVAERFLYIASLGFCLALAYGLFRIFKVDTILKSGSSGASTSVIVVTIILCLPAIGMTIDRNKDWKTEMTLYEADMPHLEKSAKANYIYATNLRSSVVQQLKEGIRKENIRDRIETVIKHYRQSIAVYPDYPDACNNLGESLLLLLNQSDSAIKYFEKAIALNPELTAAYFNLGYTYQVTEQYDKSIVAYEQALAKEPWDIKIMTNLAQMYHKVGNTQKAIAMNEDIIKLDPSLDLPYINLGSYKINAGETEVAMEYFNKALEINPRNFNLTMKLHEIFKQAGDSITAEYYLDMARKAQ